MRGENVLSEGENRGEADGRRCKGPFDAQESLAMKANASRTAPSHANVEKVVRVGKFRSRQEAWVSERTGLTAPARVQNAELFTFTYGAVVRQLIEDYEDLDEVNKQLDEM
eukprot:scaffold689_cov333-Pavlova_lutheri.AAC.5